MSQITGSASWRGDAVSVTVAPGGALQAIAFDDSALKLSPSELAATVLGLVRDATSLANQRTKNTLHDVLVDLGEDNLQLLGIAQDEASTERAETTTPDSWRLG